MGFPELGTPPLRPSCAQGEELGGGWTWCDGVTPGSVLPAAGGNSAAPRPLPGEQPFAAGLYPSPSRRLGAGTPAEAGGGCSQQGAGALRCPAVPHCSCGAAAVGLASGSGTILSCFVLSKKPAGSAVLCRRSFQLTSFAPDWAEPGFSRSQQRRLGKQGLSRVLPQTLRRPGRRGQPYLCLVLPDFKKQKVAASQTFCSVAGEWRDSSFRSDKEGSKPDGLVLR